MSAIPTVVKCEFHSLGARTAIHPFHLHAPPSNPRSREHSANISPELAAELHARNIPAEFLDNATARSIFNTLGSTPGSKSLPLSMTMERGLGGEVGTQEENAAALREMMRNTTPPPNRDRQEAAPPQTTEVGRQPASAPLLPQRREKGPGDEGQPSVLPPSDGYPSDRSLPSSESETDRSTVKTKSTDSSPAPRCSAHNRHGEPCRAQRVRGSDLCFHHNPRTAPQAYETSARAGATPREPHTGALIPLDFSCYNGFQASLETVARLELTGAISPQRAAAINRTLTIAARNLQAGHKFLQSGSYDEYRDTLLEHIQDIEVCNTMADYRQLEARKHNFLGQVHAYYQAAEDFGILNNITPKRPHTPAIPRR